MSGLSRVIMIVPAFSAFALLAATPTTTRKCGQNLTPGVYLLALDGVITERKSDDKVLDHIKADDIHSVEVTCLNPQDSTVTRGAGIPIVLVWTKGSVEQLKGTLTAIVAAQDELHQRTGKYTADVKSLGLPATTTKLDISIETHERGWVARGTMRRFNSTCTVFDGDVAAMAGRTRRQVSCG